MLFVRHPVQMIGKLMGKYLNDLNSFVWNMLFYLFLILTNHQLKLLAHQSGEKAKSK